MTVIAWCIRSPAGLVASLLAVAVAGCGGAHKASDQQLIARQQVTRMVRSYVQAQTAGDGQAACALLTAGGQRQLTALVMQASKGLLKTRPSCEDAVGLIRGLAGPKLLGALAKARVADVQVTGRHASAQVVDGVQFPAEHVSLEKVGADWKIAAVPGLGG